MLVLATSPPMSAISIRAAIISTKRPGSRRLTQSITRRTTRRASCCRSSTDGAAGDGCPVGVPGDPDPVARGSGRHNKGSPYSGGRRLFRLVTAAIDYTPLMPTVSFTDSTSRLLTITLDLKRALKGKSVSVHVVIGERSL